MLLLPEEYEFPTSQGLHESRGVYFQRMVNIISCELVQTGEWRPVIDHERS